MKKELKVGDRVNVHVYWARPVAGTILSGPSVADSYEVTLGGRGSYHFNRCQLTPLRKKQKRVARRWWINEKILRAGPIPVKAWIDWFDCEAGSVIRTTPPENPEGWIEIEEKL